MACTGNGGGVVAHKAAALGVADGVQAGDDLEAVVQHLCIGIGAQTAQRDQEPQGAFVLDGIERGLGKS